LDGLAAVLPLVGCVVPLLARNRADVPVMEQVMAHFFSRAMVEQRMGVQADWNAVDSLMLKALAAAEKVARYRHAQLSAMRLSGDLNARPGRVSSLPRTSR
jgi:hypothetical protein